MSKRLDLFNLMKGGEWITSLEIDRKVGTTAAGSMAADLRKKGCIVDREDIGIATN